MVRYSAAPFPGFCLLTDKTGPEPLSIPYSYTETVHPILEKARLANMKK